MLAVEAITAVCKLNQAITDACRVALHVGMTKDEVALVLARIAEIIENSDD